jgi:metal-responsive CopG/Arc/MetJ family transcriptional regulator
MSAILTINPVPVIEQSLTDSGDGFMSAVFLSADKQADIPHVRQTSAANGVKTMLAGIITSHEARVENFGALFENTYLVSRDFHESLADTRLEREGLHTQLRDILTQNEHLRRTDFDRMLQAILSVQDGREKEVKNLLDTYFNEQKEMARTLRENLEGFKESLVQGEAQRIREFQALLKDILAKQDERKTGVTAKLKEFQEEQKAVALRLKVLLAKGRELRIRDLKIMLSEFKRKRL